jgi:acetyl esterase/lipase
LVARGLDVYDAVAAGYAGVPLLSVDYRLAPQATTTTPAEDVFAP